MYPICVYHRILKNSLCTPYVFTTESLTIRYVSPLCLSQNPQQFAMYPLCVYHRILNNSLCTPYVFTTESPTIRYVPLMCLPQNPQQFAMCPVCGGPSV